MSFCSRIGKRGCVLLKETLIKLLETLLIALKGESAMSNAKIEALYFIDMAAQKAIEDVNALFTSSNVFKNAGRCTEILVSLKSSPLLSVSKDFTEAVSYMTQISSILSHLQDYAVSMIKEQQSRLHTMIESATSTEGIDEIVKLSAPMLSATPSYLVTTFFRSGFQ